MARNTRNDQLIVQDNIPEINYDEYNAEAQTQKEFIQNKIQSYEIKLVSLTIKENMLDNIITRTNANLENIDSNNFRLIGQTQSNLMKQIENYGLLKDIVLKYEEAIFKYRKTLIEINEKKLINRIKIQTLIKEEVKEDENINTIMEDLQQLLKGDPGISGNQVTPEGNLLLEEIQKELDEAKY